MSWLRALRKTTRSGLVVERKRLEPLVALRGAAGLALVIAVSMWAFGPVAVAVASSAFGAFQAAIATFQRSWRPRPELALASGASLAVSTFLGYLTVSHLFLFLTLLVVWTFLAGISWAAGPTIGLITSANVAIMLITVTLPTSVAQAAGHAAMMIVGGLVQAVLVVLFPVRRWGAHRDALADALAAEADYARRLRQDPVVPFDPLPLMAARDAAAVTPRQARIRPAELHGTRGLAERIRPVLASLADPAAGLPPEGREIDRVRELLAAAATTLDATAHAVRHGTPVSVPPAAVATFRTPDTGSILTGPPYRAARRLKTLLEDVVETAGGTQKSDGGTVPGPRLRPTLPQLAPVALASMRRELHRGSPIARHATRVSAVAAAGYLLGTWLPLGHGYWAPLTSVMVMRPDFSLTYSRAVARFGGTLVGVTLATGVVQAAHPGTYLSAGLAVAGAALMYLLMSTGQIATQACVAAYVVFLLGMGGEGWAQTVPERVLLTLLGGVLAMIAYAVYPAWETPRLRTRLADWLTAQGHYAATVITANPSGPTANPSGPTANPSGPTANPAAPTAAPVTGATADTTGGATADPIAGSTADVTGGPSAGERVGPSADPIGRTAGDRTAEAVAGPAGGPATDSAPGPMAGPAGGSPADVTGAPTAAPIAEPAASTRAAPTHGATVTPSPSPTPTPTPTEPPDVREALLAARVARAAWYAAVARAQDEPVRHRGLSRTAADDAEDALEQMGRVAMLMEAHLPDREAAPVPAAARFAEALRAATEQGAEAVREGGVPRWDAVREALEAWDGAGVPEGGPEAAVRRSAGLLLNSLTELSEALDTAEPPMTVDGSTNADGPRNPKDSAARPETT